jgi:cbb3-type cytochrome oxidase subunit 3
MPRDDQLARAPAFSRICGKARPYPASALTPDSAVGATLKKTVLLICLSLATFSFILGLGLLDWRSMYGIGSVALSLMVAVFLILVAFKYRRKRREEAADASAQSGVFQGSQSRASPMDAEGDGSHLED